MKTSNRLSDNTSLFKVAELKTPAIGRPKKISDAADALAVAIVAANKKW